MSDDPYKSFDHHIRAQDAEIARLRAALATARLEGMKDAARWHEVRSMELSAKAGLARNFRQLLRQSDFHMESAAELRTAAMADNRPSEEIIREDRDAWPDHQANDLIGVVEKEGK